MKKIICFLLFAFFISANVCFSQDVNIPKENIDTMLCKKWEMSYVLMGTMKIQRKPDAANIVYEFKSDKTFLVNKRNSGTNSKGTWSFDEKNKLIETVLNGKSNVKIISLKPEELIMLADTKGATPDDPMELKIVYKIKNN